jgi:ATP synthase, Delta/Epsilon chain, beta-sandwich domain
MADETPATPQDNQQTSASGAATDVKRDEKLEKAQAKVADSLRAENKDSRMHVKVYAPFKTYFDDDAFSISAVNDTGPFDILPKHHNFMTLLSAGDVVVRTDRGEERVTIGQGIMHVKADEVIVFLDV